MPTTAYPFFTENGEKIYIETTRPELLAACAALVANPDDERYQPLFGQKVTSPLFDVEVEVKAHPLAKADKGSGIAMVAPSATSPTSPGGANCSCPPARSWAATAASSARPPKWITSDEGRASFEAIAGKTRLQREGGRGGGPLSAAGLLDGEPKKIMHPVNFFEKGDKPLEVVTSRQWYIRNGGRDADRRERLIGRGSEIEFHPAFMRSRYENWISGLNGDWLVSRQRFFGVPVPVWYPLDNDGNPDFTAPILPTDAQLPVDPAADAAPGFEEAQRGVSGGFIGDADVLDTWATSSLTPQIVGRLEHRRGTVCQGLPFDVRPQGHDIIRTWLFSSVVRADALQDVAPWKHAAISGWILDPDRKKMSKSKGNVIVPTDVLEEFGSDAVRYWAASAKLGADTAYEIAQMKIGRRLAIKLLNASKFVLNLGATEDSVVSSDLSVLANPLDRAVLAQLSDVVRQATKAFESYDYARALQITESFFWHFTDDYVELIKDRAYGAAGEAQQASVLAALATSLDTLLRLFAPFLPFATEEVWSWWRAGSVHRAQWPSAVEIDGDTTLLSTVGTALSGIRKAKSEAKVKQRTEVLSAAITASEPVITQLKAGLSDLKAAANARDLELVAGEGELAVSDVVLAAPEAPVPA